MKSRVSRICRTKSTPTRALKRRKLLDMRGREKPGRLASFRDRLSGCSEVDASSEGMIWERSLRDRISDLRRGHVVLWLMLSL